MFRALCVAVKPGSSREFVADFAMSLAQTRGWELDACAVVDLARLAPAEPVPLGGSAHKVQRDEQVVADARQRAAQEMSRLESESKRRGISVGAQVLEGDTVSVLTDAVQRCDALVCGHTAGGDASDLSLLQSIVKFSPRPAIVVPQVGYSGRGALIAYDGSAQAARALASFVQSGLADQTSIHIACFSDDLKAAQARAAVAEAFLQRHGITSTVRTGQVSHRPGQQILETAAQVSAGLIVMGAFGQSSVREFFFGSVTRSVLDALPVPVLLDH